MIVGEKKGKRKGGRRQTMREREREQEKREKGKMERESETGRLSKLLGPQGTCVVSYRACGGMTTMTHARTHTEEGGQGMAGRETSKSHRDLAGRGGEVEQR